MKPILLSQALFLAALHAPVAQAQDARVASRDYVENEVISFSARPGFQSTIAFGNGERIENIAVGESSAWQVTPNRRADLLFVKPASATAPVTNMTVVTDRHTYLFELRPGARTVPVYLLRFAYPHDPAPAEALPSETAQAQLIPAVQTRALPVGTLNFAWTMKGARQLYPARVFDDGRSVYLAWTEGRALPAVLSLGPDGKAEGPVNFAAEGGYLIVEGFHNCLVLRSGDHSARIETARTSPADAAALAQTR